MKVYSTLVDAKMRVIHPSTLAPASAHGLTQSHSIMPRPILATVHTDALRHNLVRMRAAAGDARVWAIVKANAYGHGLERAFEGLRSADGFAVLDLNEAQRLRALDWRGPILLLEGIFEARDLELCSRLGLGMWCIATNKSTCWQRTKRSCRTAFFSK
jgi:alanine racemase